MDSHRHFNPASGPLHFGKLIHGTRNCFCQLELGMNGFSILSDLVDANPNAS